MSKLSISKQLNLRGPKGSVQASKARKGKEKVAAPRKPVVTKGLGIAVGEAMKNSTVRERLLDIAKANKESQKQALLELQQMRDSDRADARASDKTIIGKRKGRSIDANYARPIKVVKAFIDDYNVDKIIAQSSLDLMLAYAGKTSSARPAPSTQLEASGFVTWDKKLDRVCLKADDVDALARLEKHMMHCITVLAKFEQATSIPVKAILAVAGKGRKSNLRRAA